MLFLKFYIKKKSVDFFFVIFDRVLTGKKNMKYLSYENYFFFFKTTTFLLYYSEKIIKVY